MLFKFQMGSPILRNCNRFSLCSPADSQTLTYSQSAHPQTHKLSQIRSVLTHRLTNYHRFPVCSPTHSQTLTHSLCAHPQTHTYSQCAQRQTHNLSQIPSVLTYRLTKSHRFPVCSPKTHKLSQIPSVLTHTLTNSHTFPLCSPTALHPPMSLVLKKVIRAENRTSCGSARI